MTRAPVIGLALMLLPDVAQPQAIQLVPYDRLEKELGARIDFEDLPRLPSPGKVLDGIARFDGARMAEGFAGQVTRAPAGFDELHRRPERPLAPRPGAPGENLAVEFVFFMSNQLKGMAPPGSRNRATAVAGNRPEPKHRHKIYVED